MAVEQRVLKVLVSSKQSEFEAERLDLAEIIASMPLLAASVAEHTWDPERTSIQERSVLEAKGCCIYLGLFGGIYSEPTALEYQAAASNSLREMLIYVRDCPARERKLVEFLTGVMDPKNGRTVTLYKDWQQVRIQVQGHLWRAVQRMIENALRLAEPPVALGRDPVMARKWEREKNLLLDLGLPLDPKAATELANTLKLASRLYRAATA